VTELARRLDHHRSIRKHQPNPTDPALIEQGCAEAVSGGSSSGYTNPPSPVLARDAQRRRRRYELHFDQPMALLKPRGATRVLL
jgi:hypothetical protein